MLITLHLCVLYGSQNKQQLLPYTSLIGFYNRSGEFAARYGLSPYIAQIRFVTGVESVYCAVRTEPLYSTDTFCNRSGECLQRGTH
jgi:hypothetical protein